MIHEFRILVKTNQRMSRKSVVEMVTLCLESTENTMKLPFKVQDNIAIDNQFLKDLREMKIGSFIKVRTIHRAEYTKYAKALNLDIVFRYHSEGWLNLYVIDTLW